MGAADPFSILRLHQWWRLLAANFLHFGPVHLGMNMLGLLALGPFVERSLGRWLYLPIYILSGVCGIAGVIALAARHPERPGEILVGASASIMGLVGVTGAILLAGWWRERARVARQRLNAVLLIVALQITFDHFNKMVSGSAHLIGMLGGFALTFPIQLIRTKRATVSTAAAATE
jgi:membrane associated rhomboid family serine protease